MRRVIACSLLLLLAGATVVFAERPIDPGRTDPGKPRPADDLYGDLYIVERDADTGEPLEVSLGDYACVRPLAADCTYIPLLYESAIFDPVEDDPCEVDPDFVDLLQAIDLGRMSVTKSPQSVIDQAYIEAILRLNGAFDIGLDPAGRINYCVVYVDSCEEWKTIDSPLENLALYQQLMKAGWLEDVVLAADGESWDRAGVPLARDLTEYGLTYLNDGEMTVEDFDRAASFFAAAADKTSFVSSDAVVTINTFLGINTVVPGPTPPDDASIEYFSYEEYAYEQDKCYPAHTDTTLLVPFPPEWACPDTVEPMQCFYTDIVDIYEQTFLFRQLNFCADEASYPYDPISTGGLLQFTQAVEHARSVINFLHNWSVPVF